MQPKKREARSAEPVAAEDEAALLQRVACKDRHAFEVLYRNYYRRLTRFLERVTRKPQLTDEILDDTMLVVWRKADTFHGGSQVSTWIFAIAYNKAMKALKRERPRAEARPDVDGLAAGTDPETQLLQSESRLMLMRLLAEISPDQRAVIELTYYHGYAYKDIATILGCPVDTVKTRMFHARRKLRAILVAREEESGSHALVPIR